LTPKHPRMLARKFSESPSPVVPSSIRKNC
jgi:hypothetical protein